MKVSIKSQRDIALLRQSGKILAEALLIVAEKAAEAVNETVTAKDLDALAEKFIRFHGAQPAFLGYPSGEDGEAYPATLCVSFNDEIVHGVPTKEKILKSGDLVKLDLGVKYKKMHTDAAVTVIVGQVPQRVKKLVDTTKRCLEIGIEQIYPGSRIGNYGSAVEKYATRNGFSVVKRLVGHGVGYGVHEEPQIPNFGMVGEGLRLKEGMILALEPMLNLGDDEIVLGDDPFVYKTMDGSLSAHFEHTVAVIEGGCEVLTSL